MIYVSTEQYMKIEEAARYINVSIYTIRKWIRLRKLRYYKFGGSVRIKESDLIEMAVEYSSINTVVNGMLGR